MDKHSDIFQGELGLLTGVQAKIHMDKSAQPHYYKPRPVLYTLQQKEEQEFHRLEREGIIKPVKFSDQAAPNSTCGQE